MSIRKLVKVLKQRCQSTNSIAENCHTVYSFFARRVDKPKPYPRVPSTKATNCSDKCRGLLSPKGRGDSAEPDAGMPPDMDDEKMEQA